jgi:hypothetical protein
MMKPPPKCDVTLQKRGESKKRHFQDISTADGVSSSDNSNNLDEVKERQAGKLPTKRFKYTNTEYP